MTSIPFAFKALALSVIASVGEGLTKDIRGDSKAALIELSKKDGTILNEYNLRQEPAMLSLRVVKPSKKNTNYSRDMVSCEKIKEETP
jgi:hypothetical protein